MNAAMRVAMRLTVSTIPLSSLCVHVDENAGWLGTKTRALFVQVSQSQLFFAAGMALFLRLVALLSIALSCSSQDLAGVRDLRKHYGCLQEPWNAAIPDETETISGAEYEDFLPRTRVSLAQQSGSCSGCPSDINNAQCRRKCTEAGGVSFSYLTRFKVQNDDENVLNSIPEGGLCTSKESFTMILNVTGCDGRTAIGANLRHSHPCLSILPVPMSTLVTPAELADDIDPGVSISLQSASERSFFVLRANCLPAGSSIEFDLQVEGCGDTPPDPMEFTCVDVAARLVTGKCRNLLNSWINCEPNSFGVFPDPANESLVAFPYDFGKCIARERALINENILASNVGTCPRNCSSSPSATQLLARKIHKHRRSRHHKRTLIPQPLRISDAFPAVEDEEAHGPVAYIGSEAAQLTLDSAECFYDLDTSELNNTLFRRLRCAESRRLSSLNDICAASNRVPRVVRLEAVVLHASDADGYEAAESDDRYVGGRARLDFARYQPRLSEDDGFSNVRKEERPLCDPMNVLFAFSVSDVQGRDLSVADVLGTNHFVRRLQRKSIELDDDDSSNSNDAEQGEDFDAHRIDRVSATFDFDELYPGESITARVYYVSCDLADAELQPRLSLRATLTDVEHTHKVDCKIAGARDTRCSSRVEVLSDLSDWTERYGDDAQVAMFDCTEFAEEARSYITSNNATKHPYLSFILMAVVIGAIALLSGCVVCANYLRRRRGFRRV